MIVCVRRQDIVEALKTIKKTYFSSFFQKIAHAARLTLIIVIIIFGAVFLPWLGARTEQDRGQD